MNLAQRIWYGTAHEQARDHGSLARFPILLAIGVAFIGLRFAIGFDDSESLLVYDRLTDSLLQHDNWARQTLAGALEYPPMPALLLLLLKTFALFLPINPSHWLIALAQLWLCSYLWRALQLSTRPRLAMIALPLLFCLPALPELTVADPFWVCMVPLAAILFHLRRWRLHRSLRDLVVIAINCGILVLCGSVGIVIGLMTLLTVFLFGDRAHAWRPGILTLLLAPMAYFGLLYPLFNWLVMGDAGFLWRRFSAALASDANGSGGWHVLVVIPLVIGMLICHHRRRLPLEMVWAGMLAIGAALYLLPSAAAAAYMGGGALLAGFCWAPLLAGLVPAAEQRLADVTLAAAALGAAAILMLQPLRNGNRAAARFVGQPPPAEEITALIDQYWDKSRILVFDLRTAVIYANASDRFLPRLDYYENEVQQQIRDEQFHLLVAPDNGRFYPQGNSVLSRFHRGGANWLLLERRWDSDWQLWRCVRPPPGATQAP